MLLMPVSLLADRV